MGYSFMISLIFSPCSQRNFWLGEGGLPFALGVEHPALAVLFAVDPAALVEVGQFGDFPQRFLGARTATCLQRVTDL